MRFEPANSKYFAQEICSPSFTDSLRLLGCFEDSLFVWKNIPQLQEYDIKKLRYEQLFLFSASNLPPKENLSKAEYACILIRFLYEMAIDVLDRCAEDESNLRNISQDDPPPIIVYPCIVISITHLIQSLPCAHLCLFLLSKITKLLSLERNLQVMSDLGVISEFLHGSYIDILKDEFHPLNPQIQFIFEKLASQHIQAKDLRYVFGSKAFVIYFPNCFV